jgi:hypothetical protein
MTQRNMAIEFASAVNHVIKAISWAALIALIAMVGMAVGSAVIIMLIGTIFSHVPDNNDSFLAASHNTPVSVFTYSTPNINTNEIKPGLNKF